MVRSQAATSLHDEPYGGLLGPSLTASPTSHAGMGSHLRRDPSMRKTLLFTLLLFLIAVGLVACGGSSGGGLSGTKDQPSISISPGSANILVGQTAQFSASVQNLSDSHVSWTVQEVNGGTVAATGTGATYTAPWPVGIYHVIVKSVANPNLTATAMVFVTAQFAFIEELPGGDALPFSMTPLIGTVGTDGKIGISGFIDKSTNKPVSVAMESVVLSNDGKRAIFDVVTPTPDGSSTTEDIYIANADASAVTQLTSDGSSWMPQFSPDGKQIIYIREMSGPGIWMMNADGTNQHQVFAADANGAEAYSATFSPDGTKIAAELTWAPNGVSQDGIAIMNSDGSNAIPLTGADFSCIGYDEMPAFTNDGSKIMFSRYCTDQSGTLNATYESMYSINTDGTGLANLDSGAFNGLVNYNPLAVADKILFQTNQAAVGTYAFEIYGMKTDGSGVTRLTDNAVYDGFDDSWYTGPSSLSAQQSLRRLAGNRAATRSEKIKNLRQHRK